MDKTMEMKEQEQKKLEEARKATEAQIQAQLEKYACGDLELAEPIRAGGEDVTKLSFDFRKLKALEVMDALDNGRGTSAFRLTNRQALLLFAVAAAKESDKLDERDIAERMGAEDAIKAVQLATTFFNITSRAGDKRFTPRS